VQLCIAILGFSIGDRKTYILTTMVAGIRRNESALHVSVYWDLASRQLVIVVRRFETTHCCLI